MEGFELVEENVSNYHLLRTISPIPPSNHGRPKWYFEERCKKQNNKEIEKQNKSVVHHVISKWDAESSSDEEILEDEEEDEGEVDFVYFYFTDMKEPMEFVNVKASNLEFQKVNEVPKFIQNDPDFKRSMKRYIDLAKGAYAVNEDDLKQRTGLEDKELLHTDFRGCSGAFPRPAFYIGIDESLGVLFLGIRGTQSKLELQIDTQWNPVPFPFVEKAFVHEGIFNAVRWFIDHLLNRLISYAKIFPHLKIRVVGHSLGGGIAAIFTLLARQFIPDIKAVIFAPFACVSRNLLPYFEDCCVSFINRTDLIPLFTKHKFTSMTWFGKRKSLNSPSHAYAHPMESLYSHDPKESDLSFGNTLSEKNFLDQLQQLKRSDLSSNSGDSINIVNNSNYKSNNGINNNSDNVLNSHSNINNTDNNSSCTFNNVNSQTVVHNVDNVNNNNNNNNNNNRHHRRSHSASNNYNNNTNFYNNTQILHSTSNDDTKHQNKHHAKTKHNSGNNSNSHTPNIITDHTMVDLDLYSPGDLYQIFKCKLDNFYLRKITVDFFSTSFIISTKLYRHHKVDSYRHAFTEMVNAIYDTS